MSERFQVDLAGMVDLLSRHLYSGPEAYLRELIQNAVDAVTARLAVDPDAEARIRLSTDVDEQGRSVLQVTDTGIGLTPDEAKMVFSRFWRADAGRTRESGGLGIGLSVVKEIVERHNGWVQVEGRKGEGACFTIHIPLYQGDEQQRGQKSQKSRGKSRKDQK